jgi:ABC-type transport system substrate-binding protein
VKPRAQVLFIGLVIIVLLVGEALVHPPPPSEKIVVIKSYPSTDALVQAVSNGDVDIAPLEDLAPQTLSQLKNNPNVSIVPVGNFGFTYIGLNLRNAPLNNSVFRKAMLYGYNRQRVVNEVLAGYGETLNPGFFSSAYESMGWRNGSIESYPYNPERASALLDSIGFTRSSSGVRTDPSTGQLLRTMIVYSKLSAPEAVASANLFAEDMQAIGLPVISLPETDFDFYGQKVSYYFDMYIDTEPASVAPKWMYDLFAGINDLYPAPLSTNLVGYHNSTFDACAKQLVTAPDLASAKAAALKCQEQLSFDVPAIPVYSQSLLIVERRGDFSISPITGSIPDTIAASLANMTEPSYVRIGEVAGLTDINPTIALGAADSLVLRLITNPLLTHGPDGSIQPGVVEQWQMADNNTNLMLTLRSDSEFQDGTATIARDLTATLHWLVANMIPSSPLYPALKTITAITELNDHTVSISFSKSNYFAVYEIGNLFVLPDNLLPKTNGPLALLLSDALPQSGAYALTRFVQGTEADLHSAPSDGANSAVTLSGVQAEGFSGTAVGGSQIQIRSQPFIYEGQTITNATFTANLLDGSSENAIQGSYVGFGIYGASLNLNDQMLSAGNYKVSSELYAQLPSGVAIQFGEQDLVVHPPQLLWQLVMAFLALVAVGWAVYSSTRGKGKRVAARRVRRRRRSSVTRRRRKR